MSCEVAPTYVMTIIETPAYRFSPLRLASLARSRSSQCSLANAPAGGWRSLPKRSGTHDHYFLGNGNRYSPEHKNVFPKGFSAGVYHCK